MIVDFSERLESHEGENNEVVWKLCFSYDENGVPDARARLLIACSARSLSLLYLQAGELLFPISVLRTR